LVKSYRIWIHGVNIIPEFTKEYTGDDNGLRLNRTAFGAVVRQRKGTNNWFHLAIPTLTTIRDTHPLSTDAYLRFRINTGAVIRRIAVSLIRREADNIVYSQFWNSGEITISGQKTEYHIDFKDHLVGGPLVISTQVYFEADDGEIRFLGAGGRFKA